MAPGVTVTTPSGAPGADGGAIRIRGINSFGGSSTAPLVLIDGIEGSLDSVDPVLIESISILKDAASSSIYGSRAANGVILVTTKRSSTERFTVTYKALALDDNVQTRSSVLEVVSLFRAHIVDYAADALVVEVTGDQGKVDAFLRALEPFGIKELAQSGLLAIGRGGKSITERVLRG